MHGAGQKPAQRLTTLLQQMQKREEVTPDSFFNDVALLRETIRHEEDATAIALYRAALAHILAQNAYRAQTYHRATESHPDSIQEWSREEYLQHARNLYQEAMKDLSLLQEAKTRDWLPLVHQGRDEAVYGGGMLYVVWNALTDDIPNRDLKAWEGPGPDEMIAFYRSRNLLEAALRMELYQTDFRRQDLEERRTKLLQLKDEYQHIPACALVYLELSRYIPRTFAAITNDLSGALEQNNQERKAMLDTVREGLKRYPTFAGKAELQNREKELLQPSFSSSEIRRVLYPGTEACLPFTAQNVQDVTVRLYQLPDGFKTEAENAAARIRQQGKLVKTIRKTLPRHEEWETFQDTLRWATSAFGHYALLVDGKAPASFQTKAQTYVHYFDVSALDFFTVVLPNGHLRLVTVDAQSGEPQPGVSVEVFRQENDELQKPVLTKTTDQNGRVEFAVPDNMRATYMARLSRSEDKAFTPQYIWLRRFGNVRREGETLHLQVFTDRAIYRPGQTVYMAAVAYKQKEWKAQTMEGRPYKLTFYDANRQKILEHELKTDAYGVISDTLQLPASGLPGQYMLRVGSQTTWIRVEEYRRPTFQVEMDEAPALQWPSDSITLSGRALTYSGVPVSHARVTGTFHWSGSRWFWSYFPDNSVPEPIDTVFTDQDGRFSVRIPLKRDAEQMKRGQLLSLSVDVLSAQGETQQGQQTVPLCTSPLRIWGSVPEQQDKGQLTPWTLNLYSSTDKPLEGTVHCTLYTLNNQERGAVAAEMDFKAGESTVPEKLSTLPSGRYQACFTAQVNGHKAEYETQITFFSEDDTRLTVDTTLWVYCPADTFSPETPARVQIGSSLKDAWIHCTMVSEGGLDLDTIVHVQDSVFLWKLPYNKAYRQGARLSIALYHEGNLHTQECVLRLQKPDMALRPHWDTFRDHLRPGQQEEWRLTLRRPDGSPADANVLLSLYDASLDALSPHALNLSLGLGYHIPSLSVISSNYFSERLGCYLNFPMKFLRIRPFETSSWDARYFSVLMYARQEGKPMLMGAAGPKTSTRMYKNAAAVNTMATADAMQFDAVAEEAAEAPLNQALVKADDSGLNIPAREAEGAGSEEAPIDASLLRQNLNELAFFMPQLRTDAQGTTAIAFTLPESMTSWHLTGFAHTRDLMTARLDETIVAQKELMAELNLPRFLRNGDEASLTASLRNISDEPQSGTATWQVLDAETEEVLRSETLHFELAAHADTTYTLSYKATMEHPVLSVRWIAQSAQCSDGEQRPLPVLTDMTSITETRSFSLNKAGQTQIDLQKLFAYDNSQAVNRSLTVEYTARPIWLAIQSLPSLVAPHRQDVLSLTAAYYAGSLADYIAQENPEIKAFVASQPQPEATLSRNQELTDILLQETPWVVEAKQEAQRLERLKTLFEVEAQQDRRMTLLSSIRQLQQSDGSFAWFPGMRGSDYLTCEVAYMLTRLALMTDNAAPDAATTLQRELLGSATRFLEKRVASEVAEARKRPKKDVSVSLLGMQYLYVAYRSGWQMDRQARQDADFLLDLLRRDADSMQRGERALAAIILSLSGQQKQAQALLPRLRTLMKQADGTYLAYPGGSFTSIDRKVQTHVQVMEAFQLVEPQDTATLRGMQEWLLGQKRTQEWEQPVQTADAVYALLQSDGADSSLKGSKFKVQSSTSLQSSVLTLRDGRKSTTLSSPETPMGYLRERVDVKSPRTLTVNKKEDGLSWGAVYAQYQIPASQVEAQREGLNIQREVQEVQGSRFKVQGSKVQEVQTVQRVGDRIHVRYVITADRDYEYVRLLCPRPAAAEPDSQLSGYRWQGGLGYYRAIHDASSEYFIDHMPRGTYVIEEDWLITRSGNYTLSPAMLQCLYAPEFQAHTAGSVLRIEP